MRKALLVTLAIVAATPAMARGSTASEREVTRQLNLQAARDAAPDAARAPAPQAPTPRDATAGLAPMSPPAAAPTTPVTTGGPLSSVAHPPSKVALANVLDAEGKTVGAVQRVELSPQGTPTKVAVALIGKEDHIVVLDAESLRYDPARNEMMAQATQAQLKALPRSG